MPLHIHCRRSARRYVPAAILASLGLGSASPTHEGDTAGLTMGSQLRFRAESRNNFKFDDSRAGNDEGFVLSRFRWDLTWRPAGSVTGVVELQDARIFGERAIDENRAPNIFADELDVHQAFLDLRSPRRRRCRCLFGPGGRSFRTRRSGWYRLWSG